MSNTKIRVLVIDDSTMVRSVLVSELSKHPRIEVVGIARDGVEGLEKISELRPDVVTLDVEMPRLNGISVLERSYGRVPVSFIMVSTLTQAGAQVTIEALEKGAFDYITKPTNGLFTVLPEFRRQLHELVIAAARAKHRALGKRKAQASLGTTAPTLPPNLPRGWVVAIGISCGGPQTLLQMLPCFPSDFAPILVTQHMPAQFTASFADRLNGVCSMNVCEAQEGQVLRPGTIFIAPGGEKHMRLKRRGADLMTHLEAGPKVSLHRPSVDVLFDSVARNCGSRAIGIIMTGMGSDGARGLVKMRREGAWTIAQSEETCAVYGMPKEAVRLDGVDHIVALAKIPLATAKLMQKGYKPASAISA